MDAAYYPWPKFWDIKESTLDVQLSPQTKLKIADPTIGHAYSGRPRRCEVSGKSPSLLWGDFLAITDKEYIAEISGS